MTLRMVGRRMAYPSMEGTHCSCAAMLALNTKRPLSAVASTAYISRLLVDRPGKCVTAGGVKFQQHFECMV